MNRQIRVVWLAGMFLLASCVQTGTQIGASPSLCCPGDYANYATYGLSTEDMPQFLRDYVVAEFDAAFQAKGLRRNDSRNDLRVLLRYNHINLNPEQQDIDPFERIESQNVELSYIAAIDIEMVDTRSNELVWAGSISRIHRVTPGEYMHEAGARPAFQQAFSTVLESYPSR